MLPPSNIKLAKRNSNNPLLISAMVKVNGIDLNFIFKKRHSPETDRLRKERNRILKPNKTRSVRKGGGNERIHGYRPSQEGRKQIEKVNILIKNRFFHFCKKSEQPHSGNFTKT